MKRKYFLIIVLVVAAAAVAVILYSAEKGRKNNLYVQGCAYIESEDYEKAADCFSQLKGYMDAEDLYRESRYRYAVESMEEDPKGALAVFEEIGEYQDSETYQNQLLYSLMKTAIDTHALDEAEDYAKRIPEYQDVPYQRQYILYLRYLDALDQNDTAGADEIKAGMTEESLRTKAERIYEFSTHGAPILAELKGRFEIDGAAIDIKEVRCYQYAYNNDVQVPVYLVLTEYTDPAGNKVPRYVSYMDMTYYGFCDTITRTELNMQDEQQLYAFLKTGPYWDQESTYHLSTGLMKALAGVQ